MDTTGEDVKRMVQEVGSTLQRTLSESPQIAHCLNRIKAEGYEVCNLPTVVKKNEAGVRSLMPVRARTIAPRRVALRGTRQAAPATAIPRAAGSNRG